MTEENYFCFRCGKKPQKERPIYYTEKDTWEVRMICFPCNMEVIHGKP